MTEPLEGKPTVPSVDVLADSGTRFFVRNHQIPEEEYPILQRVGNAPINSLALYHNFFDFERDGSQDALEEELRRLQQQSVNPGLSERERVRINAEEDLARALIDFNAVHGWRVTQGLVRNLEEIDR